MTVVENHWQNTFQTQDTVENLWDLFVSQMRSYGFDSQIGFAYADTNIHEISVNKSTSKVTPKGNANNLSYIADIPYYENEFIAHVFKNNLIKKGPLTYHLKANGTIAIVGRDFLDESMPNYQDAKEYWDSTEKFGLRNALCIPFNHNGPWSTHGIGLHSTLKGDDFRAMIEANIDKLLLKCHQFVPRFYELYRKKVAQDAGITERQLQVLKMVCFGLTNSEISQKLDISESAISFHLSSLKEKLKIQNNRGIPLAAVRFGYIDLF